jgi:hypothetical protein
MVLAMTGSPDPATSALSVTAKYIFIDTYHFGIIVSHSGETVKLRVVDASLT